MHNSIDYFKKKTMIFPFILFLLSIIILIRLFYLQIRLTRSFLKRGEKNFLRIEKINPPRGNILDCNKQLLATNRPVLNIFWQGSGNYSLNKDQQKIIRKLEQMLNKNLTKDKLYQIKMAERHSKITLIAEDINFDQLSKIEEQLAFNPNILIKSDFKRFYPHKSMASHILGYLSKINLETFGRMGLEKMCEDLLKGKEGKIIKIINAQGKGLNQEKLEIGSPGKDIITTIDIRLQKIAEKVFPEDKAGTLILIDPKSGAIKALVVKPNFNPETFLHGLNYKEWQKLQAKKPFLNRAFNACYPPASIFKLITMSAALENNLISTDSTLTCKGFIKYGNRKYYCVNRSGHGTITAKQALALSCNILFFEIGKNIDIDILADYARRFGLGEKTNLLFSEKNGLIPNRKWKMDIKGEPWWQGETLSVAIGQSFLLTTPIQITRMIAAIFEGYLVKPRILENETIIKTPLNIKPKTLEFLKESMQSVVTEGTGKRVNKIKDINVFAKTGTAQTIELQNNTQKTEFLEHAWFVANFNYKGTPPLTMTIIVEHVGISRPAAVIAKNFLLEYRKLKINNLF